MLQAWNGNHWKPARSEPQPITKGKHKGKFRVQVFTGNPEHPQGFSQLIVNRDDLREIETKDPELIDILPSPDGVPAKQLRIKRLQAQAKQAVKYGNGLQQPDLFKKPEQRGLF